jgi:hypothetical protein
MQDLLLERFLQKNYLSENKLRTAALYIKPFKYIEYLKKWQGKSICDYLKSNSYSVTDFDTTSMNVQQVFMKGNGVKLH